MNCAERKSAPTHTGRGKSAHAQEECDRTRGWAGSDSCRLLALQLLNGLKDGLRRVKRWRVLLMAKPIDRLRGHASFARNIFDAHALQKVCKF